MEQPKSGMREAERGWQYLLAVCVLCAPSLLPYGLSALYNYSQSRGVLLLGIVCAAASPFAFVAAVLTGLVGLLRPASSWQVRFGIIALQLAALVAQIDLSTRTHYW